ncbi:MAG: hypothetical protein AAGD05_00645 [Bacteroidota bacterium]
MMTGLPYAIWNHCCFCLLALLISPVLSVAESGMYFAADSLKTKKKSFFDELHQDGCRTVTLTVDLQQVLKNRSTDETVKGQFTYWDSTEQAISRSVKVQVRGKTRRKICDFPPLKLKFKKKELKKTHRGKFNTFKLVTHCLDSKNGTQNLLKELLAYRMYNRISEWSFRTQLLKITYIDSRDSTQRFEQYGFIIEDDEELAERQTCELIKQLYNCPIQDFDQTEYLRFALFQYMIGNTDWYIELLHNIKLMTPIESQSRKILVPYDFDFSGLVSAAYAKPNPTFNQVNVRERIFMGHCADSSQMEEAIARFHQEKDQFYELIETMPLLTSKEKKKCRKYLDGFYKIIEKPGSWKKKLVSKD